MFSPQKGPSKDTQKSKATDSHISPNVSTIEKASFLDECDTYGELKTNLNSFLGVPKLINAKMFYNK